MKIRKGKKKKHNIAVVQFHFYPEITAVSQLLADLLIGTGKNKGLNFTVFCGTSRMLKNARRVKEFQKEHGIKIVRIPSIRFGKPNYISRMISFSIFYLFIFFYFLFSFKWELVINMTSPPLVGFFSAFGLSISNTRYIPYLEDLYPELLYDMGYIKRPWFIRKLQNLNGLYLKHAYLIITLGDFMTAKLINNYNLPTYKIAQIPNWTGDIEYKDSISEKQDNSFILLYSGNLGLAHEFYQLQPLIREMKRVENIRYVFIGGGRKFNDVKTIFKLNNEKRVSFSGYQPRKVHEETLSRANVFIISQKKNTVGDILPSKIYSYLAAGRPILFFGPRNSEIGKMILNNDIGIVFEKKEEIGGVVEYLHQLKNNHDFYRAVCMRASNLYSNKYGFKKSKEIFENLVLSAVFDK